MDEYTNSLSNSSCPTESTYQPLEYLASTRGFKNASFNITSLVAHIDELKIAMSDCIPDILCVNETRLDKSISDNIIKIHGYVCIRKDRNRNGGGVSVYIRETINFRSRSELIAESLEAVCIEIIKPNSKPFAVIACYRPPNSPLDFLYDQMRSPAGFYTWTPIVFNLYQRLPHLSEILKGENVRR